MKTAQVIFTPDQQACISALAEWCGGSHHMNEVSPYGQGISMSWSGDLATYDFDGLTRLVILAHRDAIRFAITYSGPRMVKICAWNRKGGPREGLSMSQWHPSLDDLKRRITEQEAQ